MGIRRLAVTFAVAFILLAGAAKYYHETIGTQVPGLIDTPSDFKPYYQAARNIVHGRSPFLADGYIYPPLLAFFMTPLTSLDYVTARRTWFAISQGLLIAASFLLWNLFGRDAAIACSIAIVWALGGAAGEALGLGQVGPLLTLCVVLAFTAPRWKQSAAIATGFAIKFFPGILGIAILLRRERRGILWLIGSTLAAVVLPWAAVTALLKGPAGATNFGAWAGTPATLSWSLPSVVLRAMDRPHQVYPLPHNWIAGTDLQYFHLPAGPSVVSLSVALLTLFAGLAALLRAVRYRLTDSQVPWAMAGLIALALAASPIGWTHYQVLQYPGVALLFACLWRERNWAELSAAVLAAALLYPLPVAILAPYYLRYQEWTANSPVTLYLWTSVTPFASLAMFWLFVRRAVREA